MAKICVIRSATKLFDEYSGSARDRENEDQLNAPLLGVQLNYLGGTIQKADQIRFSRLLFRATRGMVYAKYFDMNISQNDVIRGLHDHKEKLVYIVMYEKGKFLKDRITKLCSSF